MSTVLFWGEIMNREQVLAKISQIRQNLREGKATVAEKQWVIDQCILHGSRVTLQARLTAWREGFKTTGLQVI